MVLCAVTGAIGAVASRAKAVLRTSRRHARAAACRQFSARSGRSCTWYGHSYAVHGLGGFVWRERGFARARGALGLFIVQLAFNALWSWLFFGWHRGALAFADILVLLALIVATIVAFARIRKAAAWLLAPYLAWVSFATLLSYSVWQRNPHAL